MQTHYTSLNTKATVGLILIGVIGIISLTAIFKTIVYKEIILIEQDVIEKEGDTIVAQITGHLSSVERLVQNMAQLGKELPKNNKIYHDVFPQLLGDNDVTSHIAGGGIWPEPFEFNKKVKRMSFFWGREQTGLLKYYDDYNDPKGKGYQNEEWYVPAKYIGDEDTYWSRSYMDPYSYEAMVTATVPYTNRKGNFSGVATVDIKLSGLNKLFNRHAEHHNGYIFAVDRNNVFLSFPENKSIKPYEIKNNKPSGQYFTLERFSKKYTGFSAYKDYIKSKRMEYSKIVSSEGSLKRLSSKIEHESYQISSKEALRIATDIKLQRLNLSIQKSSLLYIENDPVLKTDTIVSLHYLPKYHWFVAIVTPRSVMLDKVDRTTKNIFLWMLLTFTILFILVYLIFSKIIIYPLKIIGKVLEENISANNHEPLPISTNDEIGQLATLFNQYSDIVEKSRYEADEANNAKSEFLSRMSHELRTPLNAIIGFSQLLEMEDDFSSKNKKNIHEIFTAGNHLLLLVNDLIDISRIENNSHFLDIKPHNLNTLIYESIKLLNPIKDKNNITIDTQIDDTTKISVIVDRTALKQVLINVITNAIKYNKQNGNIIISTENNSSYSIIKITDTGIGISADKLDSVFEPFNRIGKEYSSIEGTGIGLYVTKKLLVEMQGTISVLSEEHKGTTFTIKIPVSKISATENEETKFNPTTVITNSKNINILIVEDILSNQKIIQQQINSLGYSSGLASNGEQALALLEENKYNLILTDCTMPVMDGYELTKQVRAHQSTAISSTPIIAVTANVSLDNEKHCLDVGMNDYISKPIDIKLLNEKIEQHIRR